MEEVGSNMKEFLFVTQGYLKAVGPSRSWAVSEWRPGRRKKKIQGPIYFFILLLHPSPGHKYDDSSSCLDIRIPWENLKDPAVQATCTELWHWDFLKSLSQVVSMSR